MDVTMRPLSVTAVKCRDPEDPDDHLEFFVFSLAKENPTKRVFYVSGTRLHGARDYANVMYMMPSTYKHFSMLYRPGDFVVLEALDGVDEFFKTQIAHRLVGANPPWVFVPQFMFGLDLIDFDPKLCSGVAIIQAHTRTEFVWSVPTDTKHADADVEEDNDDKESNKESNKDHVAPFAMDEEAHVAIV